VTVLLARAAFTLATASLARAPEAAETAVAVYQGLASDVAVPVPNTYVPLPMLADAKVTPRAMTPPKLYQLPTPLVPKGSAMPVTRNMGV